MGREGESLYLVVVEGPDSGRWLKVEADRAFRIGRASDNDLGISDTNASRHHVEIRLEAAGVSLRDLGSKNGTFVGGVRVESHVLAIGDRFRIGQHVLAVSRTQEGAPAKRAERYPSGILLAPTGQFVVRNCVICGTPLPLDLGSDPSTTLCPRCWSPEERRASALADWKIEIGSAFGRFRVVEEIGEGGMGWLFRVTDSAGGGERCLKVLRPELSIDRDSVERLSQEALSLSKIEHPGIVRFHGLGREGPFFYLVLEYVAGVDLRQKIDAGPALELARVARWGTEIGRALAYAHANEVIHRDVKPSNVLVDLADRARLTDFGMARILGAPGHRLTRTGSSLGTLKFCPPELLDDAKEAGPEADQFGLAATLYYALAQDFPFAGESLLEVVRAMRSGQATPVTTARPDLPPDFGRVLGRALATDPISRYESVEAFVRELERYAAPASTNSPATN